MAVASGGRAFFTVENNGPFFCQFNPKELKLEDTAAWKPSDEHGQGKPLLTYERGQPAVLTMDLIFDETHTKDGSVQKRIDALRAMTFPSVPTEPSGHRPPHVDFHWSSFEFKGIVEKVSASALMFRPDGTAIRAKVSVTMKERKEDGGQSTGAGSQVTLSAMGQMVQGASATTTTIQPNQTLSQAAAASGTSFRAMARANPQVNPLEPVAGQQVVIPGSEQLANVLANNALGVSPSNTSPMGDINPFALDEGGDGFSLDDLGDGDLSSFFNSAIDAVEDKAHDLLDVVEDKVQDFADDVIDEAVEIGDKVGLGDEIEGLRDDAHKAISDGADMGHEEIDKGADKAHEVADEVVEEANELVDEVEEEAHELLDKAEDKAHEVADDVIDAGVEVGDKVGMGDKVEGVRGDAHDAISDGADSGHEAIDEAADSAHGFIGGGE